MESFGASLAHRVNAASEDKPTPTSKPARRATQIDENDFKFMIYDPLAPHRIQHLVSSRSLKLTDSLEKCSIRFTPRKRLPAPRRKVRLSKLGGEMAEWFKAHAWKACVGNTTVSSNLTLSATLFFPFPLNYSRIRSVTILKTVLLGVPKPFAAIFHS